MTDKNFADRLKSALEYRNLKQIDLTKGAKLNRSLVSGYLNNKYEAKNDKIDIIAKYLNVSQLYLMGLIDDFGEYESIKDGSFLFKFDDENGNDEAYIIEYSHDSIDFPGKAEKIRNIINILPELSEESLMMVETLLKGMKI